jgi:hypothetical protein
MYTVTEGDTVPSISCTVSCRPQCIFMWTGPNVPDGTTKDLYLQNINRNQKGTFNCTATNEVRSHVSSNVVVDIQCKLLLYYCRLPIHVTLITKQATQDKYIDKGLCILPLMYLLNLILTVILKQKYNSIHVYTP